jgi:hypothetical protein
VNFCIFTATLLKIFATLAYRGTAKFGQFFHNKHMRFFITEKNLG